MVPPVKMAMMPYAPATLLRSAKRLMMLTPAQKRAQRPDPTGQVRNSPSFKSMIPKKESSSGILRHMIVILPAPMSRRAGDRETDFGIAFYLRP